MISHPSYADSLTGDPSRDDTGGGETTVAQILLTNAQQSQPALLLATQVTGQVTAMFATIQVRQQFINPSAEWVHGQYVFPLPDNAAVDSLTLTVGDRVINAVVKERQAARAEFQQAKRSGKKAALLEQQRPNLFTMAIANIPPHTKIIADLTYQQTVGYRDGEFTLRVPTTITPRYIPGTTLAINQGTQEETIDVSIDNSSGWAAPTDRVPDAAAITPPQIRTETAAHSAEAGFNTVDVVLLLDIGLPLAHLRSDSHVIATDAVSHQLDDARRRVSLAEPAVMDRDFILRWHPQAQDSPSAAVFQQHYNEQYYSLIMLAPQTGRTEQSVPRDLIFVIDSSGSMAGASMRQALESLYQALDYLTPQDRFNVIDFDSTMRALFPHSQPANKATLSQARAMLNGIQAGGGTEMLKPLIFALDSEQSEPYLKQIVFITDGSIGNERQLFQTIHHKLGTARLFTVGIGSAPNSYFMRKAAQFGRGTFVYIDNVSEVAEKMAALFVKLKSPLLRDLQIDWPDSVAVFPSRIPDLYEGEPLVVVARSSQPLNDIAIRGQLSQQPWTAKLQRIEVNTDYSIDDIWAGRKIASLMDQLVTGDATREEIQPQITRLGLDHQLVTRYTSLIAVEKKVSRSPEVPATPQHVANLMPAGSKMAVPMPQTATPIRLFLALAGFFLLAALLLASRDSDPGVPPQNNKALRPVQ